MIVFDEHLEQIGECLVWTRKLTNFGYGDYSWRRLGRPAGRGAHIFAWERVNGPVPKGLEIHHTCRNRACCLLAHMQLLTHKEHKRLHVSIDGHSEAFACGHAREQGKSFCRICYNAYQRGYQRRYRQSHPRLHRHQPASTADKEVLANLLKYSGRGKRRIWD